MASNPSVHQYPGGELGYLSLTQLYEGTSPGTPRYSAVAGTPPMIVEDVLGLTRSRRAGFQRQKMTSGGVKLIPHCDRAAICEPVPEIGCHYHLSHQMDELEKSSSCQRHLMCPHLMWSGMAPLQVLVSEYSLVFRSARDLVSCLDRPRDQHHYPSS